jgi:macrolide transport system ATP-binding/permease protein
MLGRMRRTWRAIRRRSDWERDLDAELHFHAERRTDDLIRSGLTRAEAERQARLELGAREAYKDDCRAAQGLRWPDELSQDLRYAVRTLRQSPGFALVAILSLALGIGANTVVFGVLNALILKSLPVHSPEELFNLQGGHHPTQSFPNYRDLRDRNTAFSGLIAYRTTPMGLDTADGAHRVWGYLATGNYFDVLGVKPALGRFFQPEDDRQPGASPYAVLSYACWQSRFAADPQIAGKTIRINALSYTVLGVAPRGFQGTELFYQPELWVPMMMQPQVEGRSWLDNRSTFNSMLIGRLKPGVTRSQAETNLSAIAAALAKEYPASNEGLKLRLVRPGLMGDAIRAPAEAFTAGVMTLAGLVLLAACANLASLLAARAADRHRELAIRVSLGAGRGRIVRQLLTETIVLSLLGGAAGYGLAATLLRILSHLRAPLDFPVQFEVDPNGRVFLFAVAVSIAAGILSGLAPARQAWRMDPYQSLKGAPSGATGRRWALRDLLLTAQVAVCCVLLTACFVSVRGLSRALSTPLGFEARGLAVAGFDLGLAHYTQPDAQNLQRRALDAAAQLPGVTAAAYSNSTPLSIDQSSSLVFAEKETDFGPSKAKQVSYFDVSPGYFRTMGTRLIAGRDFTWRDDKNAPRVAIVNETFARKLFGTRDAIGLRFRYARNDPPIEVIGVVEAGKYSTLTEAPRPALFRPAAQSYNATTTLLVRSRLPEAEVAGQLRKAIGDLDGRLPLYGVGSLTQMLGFAFFPSRAATVALSAFGVLAIMLAITGIYGLAAYAVSRRIRDIGIRIAVGARSWQVLRSVLGHTAALLAIGSSLGLALGLAAGQVLSSVVYEASARDPLVLAAVALTMAVVGLGAALAPARQALSIDPIRALREE